MAENIHFLTGLQQAKRGDFEQAAQSFTQLLELESSHVAGRFNRGMAYFKLQQFEKAIDDFSQVLVHQPNNADIYSQRGVAYHLSKQAEPALADLNRAAELEPENPYRYSSRAFVRAYYKDVFGAVEDYEKAIALDPDDAVAHNNLGMLKENIGYNKEAKNHFERADNLTGGRSKEVADKHPNPLPKIGDKKKDGAPEKLNLYMPNQSAKPKPATAPTVGAYAAEIKKALTSRQGLNELVAFVKELPKRWFGR